MILRRAAVIGGGAAAALLAVYLAAVRTPPGQRFEDAVLRAAEAANRGGAVPRSVHALATISAASLTLAAALVVAIGLARRRPSLAVAATAVIAGCLLTTEI